MRVTSSCAPGAAELQIVGKGKGGRVKARGVIEDQPVSPLPAAWNGTIDLAGTPMKPPEVSYEITNLELCFIDLIAAGLLPAPAEKARWSAAEAIAHLVKGVPLPWEAWQRAGASAGGLGRPDKSRSIDRRGGGAGVGPAKSPCAEGADTHR